MKITWRNPLIDLMRLVKPFDYKSVLVFVNFVDADQIHWSGAVAHDKRHIQGLYRTTTGSYERFFS